MMGNGRDLRPGLRSTQFQREGSRAYTEALPWRSGSQAALEDAWPSHSQCWSKWWNTWMSSTSFQRIQWSTPENSGRWVRKLRSLRKISGFSLHKKTSVEVANQKCRVRKCSQKNKWSEEGLGFHLKARSRIWPKSQCQEKSLIWGLFLRVI